MMGAIRQLTAVFRRGSLRWNLGQAGRKRRGVTLIELVVVIAIILVLMGLLLGVYVGALGWAKGRIGGAVSTRDSGHSAAFDE